MNGRIFVLLAATGLFVHVWNANHSPLPEETAALDTAAPSEEVSSPRLEISLELQQPADVPEYRAAIAVNKVTAGTKRTEAEDVPFEIRFESIIRSKASPSVSSLWIEPALLPDQLPQGIAAGLYQVVDNFGHMTLAQITPERLAQAGVVTEGTVRDLYVHQSGNQRWYFIRQGEISESYPTVVPVQAAPATVTESTRATSIPPGIASQPSAPETVTESSEECDPLLIVMMRNRVLSRQRDRFSGEAAEKLATLRSICLAALPEAARDLGAAGMNSVEERVRGMAELVLQRFENADFLPRVDWLPLTPEVQDLPSVSVPSSEVELPEIPLRTVRESRSELPR